MGSIHRLVKPRARDKSRSLPTVCYPGAMGRMDIMKSLLRSAAHATSEAMTDSGLKEKLQRGLQDLSPVQARVSDRQLAQAIGRSTPIAAATVRVTQRGISLELETTDGAHHSATIMPISVSFAPRGAKEITFTGMPESAMANGHVMDACASIAAEIARSLWRPILRGQASAPEGHTHQAAFLHRSGAELIADLKTVPEVRRACGNPVTANLIDALSLTDIALTNGDLQLRIGLPRP